MLSLLRIKRLFWLIPTLFSLVVLSACSESGPVAGKQNQPAAMAEEKEVIALVMKTLTNPFFIEMERGARDAERELGVRLVVKTAAQETSIQQQIGIVEDLIRDQVDAIVIAPGDSVELVPVLKRAQDAGVVVINIDNRLDQEFSRVSGLTDVPFISVDNEQGAYTVVQALTRPMTVPTQIAILEGIREAGNAIERKNGALRAIRSQPLAELVAQETAHWKIDEAYDVTRQMFEQHPQIKALFCANDMMALGAVQYLQETGRQDVKVAGYDALEQALTAVKEGSMVATIDQQAAEQGYQGVLFAHRALHGERQPAVVLIDTRLVTADSL
ncbi:substrate-binding domain-containing protein [Amphritea sp. HPY]|uniref:substrate-binding domain-containing protein n=1 Tax=Amphritea sp. HPY TaxID=3421652 RepID=UPI003D7E618C